MRFRSVKFFAKPWADGLLIGCALSCLSGTAQAMVVAPISSVDRVTPLGNHVTGSASYYYPESSLAVSATVFMDQSDLTVPGHAYDLSKHQGNASTQDILRFRITQTATITAPASPKQLVLYVLASGVGGQDGRHLVPIAEYQHGPSFDSDDVPFDCAAGPCQGAVSYGPTSQTFYHAVQYNLGVPIQVGIYPSDLCAAFSDISPTGQASGCSTGVPYPLGTTVSAPINLTFVIGAAPDASSAPATVTSGTDVFDSAAGVSVSFVNTPTPITACPSQTNIYFPGDTQIFFNANSGSNLFSPTTQAQFAAPVKDVVVVANPDPVDVSFTADYSTANAIRQAVPEGSVGEPVGGFMNSNSTTTQNYNLGYMRRDAAGIITAGDATCKLAGVQTSDIRGFLTKSSCFIATAAFDSIDAAPVEMLRRFRDRVLLRTGPGRFFVSWYYQWSPEAAEWLLRHPLFRFPVLLALIPVEVIAWLFLHPAWMALLAALNILVFVRGLRGWKGVLGEG